MLPIIINTECSPYSITLIVLSTNAISSSVSSYFLYSSSSVQVLLKSCIGTNGKTSFDKLIDVNASRINALTNLVFNYSNVFSAWL